MLFSLVKCQEISIYHVTLFTTTPLKPRQYGSRCTAHYSNFFSYMLQRERQPLVSLSTITLRLWRAKKNESGERKPGFSFNLSLLRLHESYFKANPC